MDGKPQKYEPPPVSSSGSKDKRPVNRGSGQPSAGSSSQSSSRQSQGKLVFGSNVNRSPKETQKVLLFPQPFRTKMVFFFFKKKLLLIQFCSFWMVLYSCRKLQKPLNRRSRRKKSRSSSLFRGKSTL